jgi:hypothetical protein
VGNDSVNGYDPFGLFEWGPARDYLWGLSGGLFNVLLDSWRASGNVASPALTPWNDFLASQAKGLYSDLNDKLLKPPGCPGVSGWAKLGTGVGVGVGIAATLGGGGTAAAESRIAAGGQKLYRGVPGNGTQKAALGQQGVAIPRGTALDEASLIKHVLGEDVNAGVTSWTTERCRARNFSGPDGTIIEVDLSKVSNQIVPRPNVPKYGHESEVLLKGTIQGKPTKP